MYIHNLIENDIGLIKGKEEKGYFIVINSDRTSELTMVIWENGKQEIFVRNTEVLKIGKGKLMVKIIVEEMMLNPFLIFKRWLEWLDSHDGRLYRREQGGDETDNDIAALIPTPPVQSILRIKDLRIIVKKGESN